jgi:hypothetical protein
VFFISCVLHCVDAWRKSNLVSGVRQSQQQVRRTQVPRRLLYAYAWKSYLVSAGQLSASLGTRLLHFYEPSPTRGFRVSCSSSQASSHYSCGMGRENQITFNHSVITGECFHVTPQPLPQRTLAPLLSIHPSNFPPTVYRVRYRMRYIRFPTFSTHSFRANQPARREWHQKLSRPSASSA